MLEKNAFFDRISSTLRGMSWKRTQEREPHDAAGEEGLKFVDFFFLFDENGADESDKGSEAQARGGGGDDGGEGAVQAASARAEFARNYAKTATFDERPRCAAAALEKRSVVSFCVWVRKES